jgi:hypothetical protein
MFWICIFFSFASFFCFGDDLKIDGSNDAGDVVVVVAVVTLKRCCAAWISKVVVSSWAR